MKHMSGSSTSGGAWTVSAKTATAMARKELPDTGFGARLASIRKSRGITQVQLAEAIDSNQPGISYYESKGGYPPAPVLTKLARALGVSTDALLGLTPDRRAPRSSKNEVPPEKRRLWKQFLLVEQLSERDQRSVLRLIRALANDKPKARGRTSAKH